MLTVAQQGVCVVEDSWKSRMGFGNDRGQKTKMKTKVGVWRWEPASRQVTQGA